MPVVGNLFTSLLPRAALMMLAIVVCGPIGRAPAAESTEVRVGIIAREIPPPAASDMDARPEDEGLAGGRLAIRDNNSTGAFTKQSFKAEEVILEDGQSAAAAARTLVAGGVNFVVSTLPAAELLAVADAVKDTPAILFNAAAPEDRLRGVDCRANVFHVAPSTSMLTDGLAQFLAYMRWRKLFLMVGPHGEDRLYADAMKRSARKFGLQIAAEKPWEAGPLARAKGDSPTTAEALVFTRGVDYDIAIVADEAGDFGDYVPFHTVDPRPVAGTQGLIATSWHQTLEVWGAAQAQNRFRRLAGRLMRPLDYQVWAAIRAVGEAATQTKGADPRLMAAFLRSPDFTLPGYKGVGLSFRPWDQQLRQPILIAQPKALVTVAPEKGFLHQRTPLDTLGADQPESSCKLG
jgi:ABC transporter substrate binding protein (PQQ-dependent alcohol dehydrogenase system)